MHVEDEGNVASDDLVHVVQQQFLFCKEETSRKFIKLEELIELAEQKLNLLMSIQVKEPEERFANAFGWKAKVRRDSVGQHPSVITDSSCHLELRLPKLEEAEVSECLQDNEHQLADFSIGYKTREWSNPVVEENAYAAYTGEPIYDEEQGEGQDCWPEQEFILAALNKDNIYTPNPFQSEISKSERSEELADVSNIQYLQQRNVSHGEMYIDAYDVMQPSREEKLVEISAKDPRIFQSIGSLTTNCMVEVEPQNSLPWSIEDKDMPFVANNFSGKFELNFSGKLELNGHTLFLDEKGIYTDLSKLPEPNLPTEEVVHDLKPVSMPESTNLLKLNDLSTILSSPSSELEWIEGDIKLWFLLTANSQGFESLTIYCENHVLIFDPGGGQVQNTHLTAYNNKFEDMISSEVKLGGVTKNTQLRHWRNIDFLAIEQLLTEPSQLQTKVFIIEIDNSTRLQGQGQEIQKETDRLDKIISEINQHVDYVRVGLNVLTYKYKYIVFRQCSPEMNKSMRLAYREASWKSIIIYIFDPGGDSSCLHDVSIGIQKSQQLLQDVLHGKEL